ncbi:MAG: hypothetical protein JSW65_00830 [Candidatus Bipolaricaulota bacterium]|nr:MAG: hypothetical protein JSW65_00830 [Candidatus Bipolaricaulota bacterium]
MMIQRSFGVGVLLVGLALSVAAASVQEDLESAAKHGEVAFILVTANGAPRSDQAKNMIKQAMKQVEKCTLIELDRSDPVNAELVAKFRLAGAPVPLILLTARNGVLAGGLPAVRATVDKLIAMLPSPKKTEVLEVLQAGKAVFICVSRKDMATQSGAAAACAAACGELQDKCVTVQIDMDDPAEAGFLTKLKVDRAATEPVILVVNAQGQITSTYTGAADVASLAKAATKKASGCCPSTVQGGSKSCGPGKK